MLDTTPTLTMELSAELPVHRALESGYIRQFLDCTWTMRHYRTFTQFTATTASGAHIILTTANPEETDMVIEYLKARSHLQAYINGRKAVTL